MDRINSAGAILDANGHRQRVDKNISTGTNGTELSATYDNDEQEELIGGLIEWSGQIPTPGAQRQIQQAILWAKQQPLGVYATDTSATANTITLDYAPALTAYTDGMVLRFKAANSNSGACTINANGLGGIALVSPAGALQGGEIVAGGQYEAIYNAASGNAVLIESASGALAVGAASRSNHAVNLGQLFKGLPFNTSVTGGSCTASFSFTPSQNGQVIINASAGSSGSTINALSYAGSGYTDLGGAGNFGTNSSVAAFNRLIKVTGGAAVNFTLTATSAASSTLLVGGVAVFLPTS